MHQKDQPIRALTLALSFAFYMCTPSAFAVSGIATSNEESSSSESSFLGNFRFEIGVGIISTKMWNKVVDNSYQRQTAGRTYVPIRVGLEVDVYESFFLNPYVAYSVYNGNTTDYNYSETVSMAGANIGYHLKSFTVLGADFSIDLLNGLGVLQQNISGPGGRVVLTEGSSHTTWALPAKEVNNRSYFVSLGATMTIFSSFGLKAEYFWTSIANHRRRTDNAIVTLICFI